MTLGISPGTFNLKVVVWPMFTRMSLLEKKKHTIGVRKKEQIIKYFCTNLKHGARLGCSLGALI